MAGSPADEQAAEAATAAAAAALYLPSVADVLEVKGLMTRPPLSIPLELTHAILDDAEYWPHSSVTASYTPSMTVGRPGETNLVCLRILPPGLRTGSTMVETRSSPLSVDVKVSGAASEPAQERAVGGEDDPHPRGQHPFRKLVWQLASHDQGMSNSVCHRGTYEQSYTWFEADLERPEGYAEDALRALRWQKHSSRAVSTTGPHPLRRPLGPFAMTRPASVAPQVWFEAAAADDGPRPVTTVVLRRALQTNVHAASTTTHHTVTWRATDAAPPDSDVAAEAVRLGQSADAVDGAFVRAMRVGDSLAVRARAEYPHWRNYVESVGVDVFWAV
ncbi:MAG: hypothetical protein M1832_000689 [Thelocarpon impressellum]|nr:MAG: hypothetical protein M1832_000689 [Thelocarpon impressellum]